MRIRSSKLSFISRASFRREAGRLATLALLAAVGTTIGVGCSSPETKTEAIATAEQPVVEGTNWQLVGPTGTSGKTPGQTYSGVVFDIATDAAGTNIFATTNGGGLFKWNASTSGWDSLIGQGLNFHALRGVWFKPSDPNVVVVATGGDWGNNPILPGDGVYRTVNAGSANRVWSRVTTGPSGGRLYKMVPGNVDGTLFVVGDGGIWKSVDAGATFTQPWWTSGRITDLAIDPTNANIMYAAQEGVGIFKTTSGGAGGIPGWSAVGGTCEPGCSAQPCLPVTNLGRISFGMSPSSPSTVYVTTAQGGSSLGLWRTKDGGATWCKRNMPLQGLADRNQILAVAPKASSSDPDVLIVGTVSPCLSEDGGATYRDLNAAPPPGVGGIQVHADNYVVRWRSPQAVYIGTDGGLYHSTNGGRTWQGSMNKLPNMLTMRVDVQNVSPYDVWGSFWDNGIFSSGHGGFSDGWAAIHEGGDGVDIVVDSNGNNRWHSFGSGQPGTWGRYFSSDNGVTVAPAGVGPDAIVSPWFASDRSYPLRVYANSTNKVYRSALQPWTGWELFGELGAGVDQLTVTQYNPARQGSVVYAPTGGGSMLKVYDNGWSERSTGLPAAPTRVAVPESGESPVFAVMYGGSGLANSQKLRKSTNNGQTWTSVASGGPALPIDAGFTDLKIHPRHPKRLFLATDRGVYKSIDQGATWTDWNSLTGLPFGTFVSNLKIGSPGNGRYWLYAATWGHSIWKREISASTDGDFDGDRKADIAVWRPTDHNWYIIKSSGAASPPVAHGGPGDIPVVADYDGDGIADIAVWRPSNHIWYIIKSSGDASPPIAHGDVGDVPVPADYDGDGIADIAVWRPSDHKWYIIYSSGAASPPVAHGDVGDMAVPADYDGDGKTDIAVWRPSNSVWYINPSSGTPYIAVSGSADSVPVPADYDGDGRADLAMWRPSTSTWSFLNSIPYAPLPNVLHGTTGDIATVGAEADQGCKVHIGAQASCSAKCISMGHPNGGYCPYRHATLSYNSVSCFCNP